MKFGEAKYEGGQEMERCFFVGHRDAPDEILPLLAEIVEKLIEEEGVKEFVVGRYGKFDYMAAKAVQAVKKTYGDVRLVMMTPYHPAERSLTLPDGFDEMLYPFEMAVPPRAAIVRANEQMIRTSSHLAAYVRHPGKSRDLLEYARRHNIKIVQI